MDHKEQEQVALHRWAVIAEAASGTLTPAERGALVRQVAARAHTHPDGTARRYSRGTIDRWLRAWRKGGLEALKPSPRADTGVVRAHPELFAEASALRLELPGRSAAQIASILYHRHGVRVAERTVRAQLRRAGLHRAALAAAPKAYGRYEAARPNERWITDVLVGPWVPFPRRDGSARARLFLIVDDHSRLLVDGRFFARENARACQDLLRRAITRRGLPEVFYADNGAPFSNAWLSRTCAVLGIRLVHSKPYSPQGRGKQERLNRYIREAFLAEATHHGIESLDQLNDLFAAWAGQVANRRVHAETGQPPIERFQAGGPPRQAEPARLAEAFRWSVTRRVTRTATVPLEGNAYAVDPALVGRRVELRYEPEDLSRIVAGLPVCERRGQRGLAVRLAFDARSVPEVAEAVGGVLTGNTEGLAAYLAARQHAGDLRRDLPPELLAETFFALTSSLVISRIPLGAPPLPDAAAREQLAGQLASLFWSGARETGGH